MGRWRFLSILALVLWNVISWAQPVSSTKLLEGKVPEGTVYYLPKTVFHFHLLIEKTSYTPGVFAKYAERYLHLKGIQQESQINHRLIDFQLSQTGVRDTSKCFIVNLKGKSATSEIKLSDDGVLLAVNDTPVVVKSHTPFVAAPKKRRVDPMRFLSEEVQMAGSMAKKAELTALQIAELKEHRQLLITGEAEEMPSDKAQLQLMLDEIDKTYNALMSLFTGVTECDTTEQTFTLSPDKEMKREVVFRISKLQGLVDKDDLSGIPFYLTLEDLHQQSQQQYDFPENKKDGGFYTNIPGFVRLTLYREDQQLATFDYPLAQFGFTELRGGSLFRKYPTHLRLDPITGAIEKLQAEMPKKKGEETEKSEESF